MDSILRLTLVTEGDASEFTGGHLYHQRLAQAAPAQKVALKIVALPHRPFLPSLLSDPKLNPVLAEGDAVLVDSLVAAPLARPSRSLTQRTALIAIVHQQPGGADHGPLRARVQARLDLALYGRCRLVIASSSFLADLLAGAGLHSPVVVIPPGRAEMTRGTLALHLRQGRDAAVVCVSNWTRNKSIDLLLEAIARLDSQMATLHLVGNPDVEPSVGRQLRARIARDDLRDRVVVHGSLPSDEVAAVLAAADVFAHPSRHEAYGLAISEAMAAGLPVVAFRVDNVPLLVRDGVDGILLRYADVAGLAAALAVLIRDGERRRRLGDAARASAMRRPTWEQTTEQVFAAIRHAVTSPT
jgi:glycosyltransferase involved in cell wall biosynthesis